MTHALWSQQGHQSAQTELHFSVAKTIFEGHRSPKVIWSDTVWSVRMTSPPEISYADNVLVQMLWTRIKGDRETIPLEPRTIGLKNHSLVRLLCRIWSFYLKPYEHRNVQENCSRLLQSWRYVVDACVMSRVINTFWSIALSTELERFVMGPLITL